MKKIKPGEYLMAACSWCLERPMYRSSSIGVSHKTACYAHHSKLVDHERSRDTGHMSEADHQTWGRL